MKKLTVLVISIMAYGLSYGQSDFKQEYVFLNGLSGAKFIDVTYSNGVTERIETEDKMHVGKPVPLMKMVGIFSKNGYLVTQMNKYPGAINMLMRRKD